MKYKLVNENFKEDYGANLLRSRGVVDVDLFLNPTSVCLQNWEDLDNIERGVKIIQDTINTKKPYGLVIDADCDGFSSSAIIYQYLKLLNPDKEINYFIHSGKQHGLEDNWELWLEKDYDLIICPDAATNDSNFISQLSCPVLVLDHHLLEQGELAQNLILINNQTSEKYQNKDLSGGGVTWQFCRAMDYYFQKDFAFDFIDLAALSVCGDMMSVLEYENQYIFRVGFNNIKNKFFKVLTEKQSFSMGDKINPTTVAFYIVPLINSMIRVGAQEEKERMFLAFIDGDRLVPCNKRGAKGTLERVCVESARECTNTKSRQDKLKEKITSSLEIKIHKNDLLDNKILFIELDDDDDFPPELNGLCCMQLAAKYSRPTIVARNNDNNFIKGSIRNFGNSPLTSFKQFLTDSNYFEYIQGRIMA